jgi:hypothetical protein
MFGCLETNIKICISSPELFCPQLQLSPGRMFTTRWNRSKFWTHWMCPKLYQYWCMYAEKKRSVRTVNLSFILALCIPPLVAWNIPKAYLRQSFTRKDMSCQRFDLQARVFYMQHISSANTSKCNYYISISVIIFKWRPTTFVGHPRT